jgi:hypothetical protein
MYLNKKKEIMARKSWVREGGGYQVYAGAATARASVGIGC